MASREVQKVLVDLRQLVGDQVHLSRDTSPLSLGAGGTLVTFLMALAHGTGDTTIVAEGDKESKEDKEDKARTKGPCSAEQRRCGRAERSGRGRGESGSFCFFTAARGQRKTGWWGRAGRSGRGRGESGSSLLLHGSQGAAVDGVVGEGREVRPGTRRKWFFSSGGGQRKTGWWGRAERSGRGRGESGFSAAAGGSGRRGGGGGPRGQAGDKEKVVWFVQRGPSDGGGVATNCYDERKERRQEGNKRREESCPF